MIKKILKENWIFLLFVLVASLIGGYCTGLYVYDTLSPDMLNRLQEQNVSKNLLVISTLLQYGVVFGGILAFIGLIISKKVNLWKEFKYDKQAIVMTAVITVASALILFPGDKLIFGSLNSWVYEQYEAAPAISKILAGLLTGGVTEEIIMRLFLMSLLVLIASKVMLMENKDIPEKVHIIVNVIVALLFAAGHLPSTGGGGDGAEVCLAAQRRDAEHLAHLLKGDLRVLVLDPHGLGSVDGGAAAHGDDPVGLKLQHGFGAAHDCLHRGIGLDALKQFHFHAGFLQVSHGTVQEAETLHGAAAHTDHGFLAGEGFQRFQSALAVVQITGKSKTSHSCYLQSSHTLSETGNTHPC